MTTEQNPLVAQLQAQVQELGKQLDHSRMANDGWRMQMQQVSIQLQQARQALGAANTRIAELEQQREAEMLGQKADDARREFNEENEV